MNSPANTRRNPARGSANSGMAVDSAGGIAYDPSENVLQLVEAAVTRIDDLFVERGKRYDSELKHLEYVGELRAVHAKEIRELETDRLEKIRQVDVLAGNTAADRQLVAIQTLAASQATAAETLRAMVSSTASTIATQLAATVESINKRIAMLEQSSYEGKGKEAYADPRMIELLQEVKSLRESRATAGGKSEGMSMTAKIAIAGVGLLATLVGLIGSALVVVSFLR